MLSSPSPDRRPAGTGKFGSSLDLLVLLLLSAATLLTALAVAGQLRYAPFSMPGATPGDGQADYLVLDLVRWLLILAAAGLSGLDSTSHAASDRRVNPAAWIAGPLVQIVLIFLFAAASIAAWMIWMGHLPAGPRSYDALLAAFYVLPPGLLIGWLAIRAAFRR